MNTHIRSFALIAVAIIMCIFSGRASAQDYIHTYGSTPIKAKVLEIGDDYIYYKTWDNLEGPLYNISPSKVMKITFENGSEKSFMPVSPFINARPDIYGMYPLDYRWGNYYGRYGRIPRDNVADYIGYALYGSEYMKASNQYLWGISLTSIGVSGFLMSIAAHIMYAEMNNPRPGFEHMMPSQAGSEAGVAAGYIISAGCLGAGIPLWVKGNKGLQKIADDYNQRYVNPGRNEANVSLGATRSGVGLALNF